MCSSSPAPDPPQSYTIGDRDKRIADFQKDISVRQSSGASAGDPYINSDINNILYLNKAPITPVDPRVIAPPVSPSTSTFELASNPLTPLLQKRVASTLRIPYAAPSAKTTPPATIPVTTQ